MKTAAWTGTLVAVLAVFTPLSRTAHALINPNFTPVHMTRSASCILHLELGPVGAKGEVPVRTVKAIKGAAPTKGVSFDLSQTDEPRARAFRESIGTGRQMALIFIGQQRGGAPEEEADASDPAHAAKALSAVIHLDGRWYRASSTISGTWQIQASDDKLAAVWAGGTDMLLRGVEYVLSDRDASFPVVVGAAWSGQKKIATLKGKVFAAVAVDLAGDGRSSLFICCADGDRLMKCEPGKDDFQDITSKMKLASRSQCAAWADFNGDARLDLASFDGNGIALWLQTETGTFEPKPLRVTLAGGCIGLSALDVGVANRAGLLVSTSGTPVLLAPKPDGSFAASPAAAAAPPDAKLGEAHACLVADFDGDGIADILQPFANGSLFYKGTRPGAFAAPVTCDIATGPGRAGAFLGDFDADGLLDVFVAAQDRCCLWHNLGGGKFADAMRYAGEAAYISKPGGIGGMTCDINNDGRQDLFILYSNMSPQFFFNRGFASFGHARQPIDLSESSALPEAGEGQQAGVVADFNCDGGQDMALVLNNGEVWVLFHEVTADEPALAARVGLAAGAKSAGPFTVSAMAGKRPLGAWNLTPGTQAFIGLSRPGPCTLQWRGPGVASQTKTIDVKAPVWVPVP